MILVLILAFQDDAALERGRRFFKAGDRADFLAALERLDPDARVEIAWRVEDRVLIVELSRTAGQGREMSDGEFAAWRRDWSPRGEAERRRLYPSPGSIGGAGKATEAHLATTRDLVAARDKADFLKRVGGRIQEIDGLRGLTIVFVPKHGEASAYWLPADEVEALGDDRFHVWRGRFLRWVEIHTSGQSAVTEFAKATDEEFEKYYAASKDREGRIDIEPALARFRKRTGVTLKTPRYVAKETAGIVARVDGAEGGLKEGDRIAAVEGVEAPEWNDVLFLVGAYRSGSTLKLTLSDGRSPLLRIR